MDAVTQLRSQYRQAHGVLEATMADVSPEMAHWLPPGRALPIGASYAHALLSEDSLIGGRLRQGTPLIATSWAGRAGLSELPPQGPSSDEWARQVQVDLPALREYAQAVYAATDAYLASLTPADLGAEIEGFMGPEKLSDFLTGLALHVGWHTGEVSSVKGLQGAKGYPF